MLGAVVHHREHFVEHAALGADAVLEEGGQVRLGPAAIGQVLGQQARGQVAPQQATAQTLVLLQRTDRVARGMALAAMAHDFDHVLPTLPGRAFAFGRLQLHALAVEHVPAAKSLAHVERKAQRSLRCRAVDWRHGHQVSEDRVRIFTLDQVVRGVRHRRVEVGTVLALALGYRGEEFVGAVVADAVLLVRGDVAAVNGAERRMDRQAAGVRRAAFGGVAGHAVGRTGQVFTALDLRLVGRLGKRGKGKAESQRQCATNKTHAQPSLTRPRSLSTVRVAS